MTVTGFAGFALPGEESARESVERTFAKRLAEGDACLALGVKLLQRTSSFVVTRKRTEKVGLVVMGLYMKALKTVRAIRIVASPDLVEDGFVLCRSLLETTVAILYVLQKDSPRRADEYIAHTLMRTKWAMEGWTRTHGLKVAGRRIDKRAEKEKKPLESRLGAARLEQLKRSYSGVSLEETFKRVGLNRLYQTLYRRLSVHPHAADLESHAEPSEKGGLQLKAGTSDLREMNFLLDSTRLLLCAVMQRVSQEMDMGYQAEIEALKPRAGLPTRMLFRAWKKRMQARRNAMP
jgi:hypothetical protein